MKVEPFLYKEAFQEIFAILSFLKEERNFGKPELRKSILIPRGEQIQNVNTLALVAVANGKI
jgi:hypothetical protein